MANIETLIIDLGSPTEKEVNDFIAESAIMLDFDHPNVMRLVGVCFDTEDGLPLTVLPYMANGDLKTFLRSKRSLTDSSTSTGSVEVCPQVTLSFFLISTCIVVIVYIVEPLDHLS